MTTIDVDIDDLSIAVIDFVRPEYEDTAIVELRSYIGARKGVIIGGMGAGDGWVRVSQSYRVTSDGIELIRTFRPEWGEFVTFARAHYISRFLCDGRCADL